MSDGGLSAKKVRSVMHRLLEGESDVQALAKAVGVSVEKLAGWAERPEARRRLSGLRWLADMQAQMILSRYRVTAAARLVQLAGQQEDAELARKACVELLKADLAGRAGRDTGEPDRNAGDPADSAPSAKEQANVLKALEQLGADSATTGQQGQRHDG